MTKRALSLLLVLAMLCGLLCTTTFAANGTWSGSGTQADPYLIEDAADLAALSTNVNNGTSTYSGKYFKLTADIEVSDWNPIGPSSSKAFRGDFDGDGNSITISSISSNYYTTTYSSYAGLFGYLYTGAVVHDVTVDGSISYAAGTTGTTYVGGIAGYVNAATIVNCVNAADVSTTSTANSAYLGGIAAYTTNNATNVYNCYNEGTVSASSVTNPRLGGIVGNANSGTFQYCYTAVSSVYGLNYATMTQCYDATTWSNVSDASAWVAAANASVATYTSVNDFWSLSSDNTPEHVACTHPNGYATSTIIAPTCTEDGYTVYHCNDCGKDYKGAIVSATGHTWVAGDTVSPTCTEQGYTVYNCSVCNETKQDNFVAATGHTYNDSGICTVCGAKRLEVFSDFFYGMDDYLTAVNDSTRPWTVASECLVSGNTGINSSSSTITITVLSDGTLSFDYWVQAEGGYDYFYTTLNGTTQYTSKGSGTSAVVSQGSLSYELEAGDVLKLIYYKDSSGNQGEDCTKLSNIVFTPDCTHEHRSNEITVNPTCTEDGSYSFHCNDCDRDIVTVISALGHNYVDGVCTRCSAREPLIKTIGTGTSSSYTVPYDNYYWNSLVEMIYTADEIGGAGAIESIAFEVATASSYSPTTVKIYMGHTNKATFSGSSDWVAADDLTLVYSGTPTLGTAVGWEKVDLDTVFNYNGTDNLVIVVSKTAGSYNSVLKYCYTSASNTVLYRQKDSGGESYADYSNVSTSGTLASIRPNVQLTCQTGADVGGTTYTVTFAASNATVSGDGINENSATVEAGSGSLTFTVTAADGYQVDSVEADGNGSVASNGNGSYTLSSVTGNVTVTVTTSLIQQGGGDENLPEVWDGVTMTAPTQQNGVYLIGDGEELAWFAAQVNDSVNNTALNAKLTNDIDLGGHEWTPIGNYLSTGTADYNRVYSGTFDGNDHKITGLQVTGSSTQKVTGLFGFVVGGTIKNLAVYGTVAGYTAAGGYSGGFIGQCFGVTMDNCANYATVSGNYVGGLIGTTSASSSANTRTTVSITNSYNAGNLTGTQAGGLLGELAGTLSSDTFSNCFTYGTVSATGSFLGTLYGYVNTYTGTPVIDNFYYLNTQTYGSDYTVGTGKNAEEFKTLAASLGSAFTNNASLGHPVLTWEAPSSEEGGNEDPAPGSASNPFEISTAAELQALADEVNNGDSKTGVYYVLTQDLTLPGTFTPIGTLVTEIPDEPDDDGNYITEFYENSFAGNFDGDGHTVTLNITDRTGSNARVGLFGSVVGGTVKNVTVTGSVQTVNGGSCVAALIGYAKDAVIENCGNGAVVINNAGTAPSNGAAGILGRSDGNVTITGCFNVGKITADMYAAGIVYDANGDTTITNCYDMGTLTANAENGYTGGIVAVPAVGMDISLTNCYAAGTYTATKPGAIVGTISQAMTMSNVYYQGSRWLGSDSDYGWSDTNNAPTVITSFTGLAANLGSGFKDNDSSYPLLTWQTAALTPTASAHTHTYADTVTDPTCTEQGYTTHTCTDTDCGYSYVDTYVDALGHAHPTDTSGYTHNDNDTHSFTCTRCNEVITEDCTYGDGVVTTAPTKNTDGVMTYTCAVCGGTKTEVIPATGFDMDASGNYLIQSDADLALLATKVSAGVDYTGITFKLTANVAATTSIGTIANPFTGNFDGGYHTVTLTINDSTKDFNGLFGAISGSIVEKVIVTGTITGGSFTAGIAGYATGATIRNCGNQAAITGGNNHTFGQNEGPNDCYAGGIVGYATGDTMIVSCYNRGTVYNASTGDTTQPNYSKFTGGIVGDLYDGAVIFCYNTANISISTASGTSYTYTGGIAGMAWSSSIMNSYSTGTISGGSYTGGVLGSGNLYYQQGSYSYYLSGSASAGAGTGSDSSTYILSASADDLKDETSTVAQNLSDNFVEDEDNVNGGYLILNWEADSAAAVQLFDEISTAEEMKLFANLVRAGFTYDGQTVKLLNDIDLEGSYDSATGEYANIWTAIGDVSGGMIRRGFYGTFDGDGKTISNMVILNDNSGYLGLFAVLPEGATVKNLTVSGVIDSAQSHVGSIVGWNLGTVDNCVSNVNISASSCDYVGGIVADNAGAVKNCVNNGTVNGGSASSYVGGVVGHCEPAYDTSYHAVTTPVVENCVNNGDVTGYEYVGGVVGAEFNDDGACASITGSANHGDVTGSGYAGGIVGYMSASSSNYDTIYITDCYNTGDVYGASDVGGIVGHAGLGELTIENCFSSGAVSGAAAAYVGEIAGYTKATINDTYYVLDTGTTQTTVASGSPDNGSRPVSYAYLASDAFEELIGYEYELQEAANANETASFYAYDIYTINVVQTTAPAAAALSDDEAGAETSASASGSTVTITRLSDAHSYSLTGFQATKDGTMTYFGITDTPDTENRTDGYPRLVSVDVTTENDYGCNVEAVFTFASTFPTVGTDGNAVSLKALASPKEIGFYVTGVTNDINSGRASTLDLNLGSYVLEPSSESSTTSTTGNFTIVTGTNYSSSYGYTVTKATPDVGNIVTDGVATQYIRLSEILTKLGMTVTGNSAAFGSASCSTIAFTPIDWQDDDRNGNGVYDDYIRTFSFGSGTGQLPLSDTDNITGAILALRSYQIRESDRGLEDDADYVSNQIMFERSDARNAVRLIPSNNLSTSSSDVSDSVKWISQIDLSFGSALKLGDVNGDGNVDGDDYELINSYIDGDATLSKLQFALADINGDGLITTADTDFFM